MTTDPNWGGSTAFLNQPTTRMLVGNFQKFARRSGSRNEKHENLEEALAFLDSLKPGLTEDIDWPEVLEAKS
jgi:hypothetical protein